MTSLICHASAIKVACTQYAIKAAASHINPVASAANQRCGHYVAYIKQEQQWDLANDSLAHPMLVSGMRGVPYFLILERAEARGPASTQVICDALPREIQVDIPIQQAAPLPEHDLALSDAELAPDTRQELPQ